MKLILIIILFACPAGIAENLFAQTDSRTSKQIKKVKFDETFKLQSAETVQTENGKLRIQLKRIGRTIAESGEFEYAELQILLDKSKQTIILSERGRSTKYVGDYLINLVNAESFGKIHCYLKISLKRRTKNYRN